MIPLVEMPEIVRHYASFFTSVFSHEALKQFHRYLRGLLVSENKTVEGINRIFVIEVRKQSSLNRWLTESSFAVEDLNRARFALLAHLPGTALQPNGVVSGDDTLLTHYGQHVEKIAQLYDTTQGCYVWAHNVVHVHYSADDTDYPLSFPLWKPVEVEQLEAGLQAAGIPIRASKYPLKNHAPKKWRNYLLGLWRRHQQKPAVRQIYQSKLLLGQQVLTRFYAEHLDLPLPVTFDNWYTQPAFWRFLNQTLQAASVGTLTGEDRGILRTGAHALAAFDQHLQAEHPHTLATGKRPVFHKISSTYKGEKET